MIFTSALAEYRQVTWQGRVLNSLFTDEELRSRGRCPMTQEEIGWKYIHGDVFRFPKYKSLFAAALGYGTQLFTLTVFIFILTFVGVFYPYKQGVLFLLHKLSLSILGFLHHMQVPHFRFNSYIGKCSC